MRFQRTGNKIEVSYFSLMPIIYRISMEAPQTHYFTVETIIPKRSSSNESKVQKQRFIMPVWTPGSYLIREFPRNVLEFKASNPENGKTLKSYKDTKNSWIVETEGNDYDSPIKVEYRIYAFEFTVDTSYLDNRHGIVNGASVFMYPEGYENEEIELTVVPFRDWKVIATSLEPTTTGKKDETTAEDRSTSYRADNFDILVDSPIEIGNQEIRDFMVEGVRHEVSMYGPKPIDSGIFVSDLRKIVEAEWKVFGVIPYKRYLFLVDFAGTASGGLEHLSSTHCIAPRLRLIPSQEYRVLMGLFSHELFHAWNVKRMRPKGLGPFNYSSETYTKSLWIAEGVTSYYDDLILRRAKIYSVAEYLDAFCINANQMNFLPSSKYESAEESSFDTWIRHYRPNENTPNVHSSYYNQGAVIGWMIDMEIRHLTKSSKSLDDVMRKLYNQTFVKENRGYTDEEFESVCNEVAGRSLSEEIFGARVRGHEYVDFDKYLGYAGLKLGPKSKTAVSKGYLGIKIKQEAGKVQVGSKLFTSPADKCGLAAGDEIIALDNLRVDSSVLQFYISNKKAGDVVSILISRDGVVETLHATLDEMPQIENRVYKKDQASNEERALFKHWMEEEWDTPLEYVDYQASPQRPRPLDFI